MSNSHVSSAVYFLKEMSLSDFFFSKKEIWIDEVVMWDWDRSLIQEEGNGNGSRFSWLWRELPRNKVWGLCDRVLLVFFFFFGHTHSMQKFQSQGSDPSHGSDWSHLSDSARSLTCWATRELPVVEFQVLYGLCISISTTSVSLRSLLLNFCVDVWVAIHYYI